MRCSESPTQWCLTKCQHTGQCTEGTRGWNSSGFGLWTWSAVCGFFCFSFFLAGVRASSCEKGHWSPLRQPTRRKKYQQRRSLGGVTSASSEPVSMSRIQKHVRLHVIFIDRVHSLCSAFWPPDALDSGLPCSHHTLRRCQRAPSRRGSIAPRKRQWKRLASRRGIGPSLAYPPRPGVDHSCRAVSRRASL